mgnify:CR=1 FL=1
MTPKSWATRCVIAVVLILGTAFALPLSAQNLLTNTDFPFPSGLSGWQAFDGFAPPATVCTSALTCAAFSVVPVDCCAGNPENGVSAPSTVSNAQRYLLECVAVTAGTSYEFGAWTRRTDDPLHSNGRPTVAVAWFPAANCGGVAISTDSVTTNAVPWQRLRGVAPAPVGALSAEFRLDVGTAGLNGNSAIIDFAAPFFGVDGTVQPPARIPALGGWGLAALAALLGLGGWWAMTRRAA